MSKKKAIEIAKTMPPLKHSVEGKPFNIMESEVVNCLCSQPEIRQYVFYSMNLLHAIEYDKEAGTWKGVDWK